MDVSAGGVDLSARGVEVSVRGVDRGGPESAPFMTRTLQFPAQHGTGSSIVEFYFLDSSTHLPQP